MTFTDIQDLSIEFLIIILRTNIANNIQDYVNRASSTCNRFSERVGRNEDALFWKRKFDQRSRSDPNYPKPKPKPEPLGP